DLFVPESRERIGGVGTSIMHATGSWRERVQLRNRDSGRILDVDWTMFLVRDQDGRVIATAGMGRDITDQLIGERRVLERQLVLAQEQERHRLAGEIHDDSAQAMAAVLLRLARLGRRLQGEEAELLGEVEEATTAALTRLRKMIFDLHPPVLDRTGLAVALEQYVSETFQAEDMPVLVAED